MASKRYEVILINASSGRVNKTFIRASTLSEAKEKVLNRRNTNSSLGWYIEKIKTLGG